MNNSEKKDNTKAKKGGRPKLYGTKKDRVMAFKVNEKEEKIILDKLKRLRMRKAIYLRESALHFDEKQLPRLRLEAVYEIRKIGVNFNQLMHLLNSKNVSGKPIELDSLKEEVHSFIQLLKEQLQSLKE
jgi:hypothetical protein